MTTFKGKNYLVFQEWRIQLKGAGEFLRIGMNLDKTDASTFTANLKKNIKENVKPENQALFNKDLKADKDRQKQEWLAKTANSPAAKAGMSDDMRWKAHLKNQAFRKRKEEVIVMVTSFNLYLA